MRFTKHWVYFLSAISAFGFPGRVGFFQGELDLAGANAAIENDMWFHPRPTDRYYTNGFLIQLPQRHSDRAAWMGFLPFSRKYDIFSGLSFGQNLYTPSSIRDTAVISQDRPYGAFLNFGKYQSLNFHPDPIDEDGNVCRRHPYGPHHCEKYVGARFGTHLLFGWTGPYALGRQTQSFVHEIVDAPAPKGWHHQVPSEFGLQCNNRFEFVLLDLPDRSSKSSDWKAWGVEFLGDLGLDVGTVYLNGKAGVLVRAGYLGSYFHDFTSLSITKAPSGFGEWLRSNSVCLFFEPKIILVGRNALIHCGWGKCDDSQDITPLVYQFEGGTSLTINLGSKNRLDVGLVLTARSSEFEHEQWDLAEHGFGTVHLAFYRGL